MKWLVVLVMLCGRAAADPAAVRKLLDQQRNAAIPASSFAPVAHLAR
jgi:hypothetical protein